MKVTKSQIKKEFARKVRRKLDEQKKKISKKIMEAPEVEAPDDTQPEKETPSVKFVKTRPAPNSYRFQFSYGNRIYHMEFKPHEGDLNKYTIEIYAKGQQDSDKPNIRFGVSNPANVEKLFDFALEGIIEFIQMRKPVMLRFIPGEGIQFPSLYHQYIYKALKTFEDELSKQYSIIRGDTVKDGSAFVLRKGGVQSNIKTASWRPVATKSGEKVLTKNIGSSELAL